MERFPLRLPPDLKKGLEYKAKSLAGKSMNDLVVLGVRHIVEGTDVVVAPTGVVDAHADLVALAIEGEIGPAKGIAKHFFEIGQPNLGALLYCAAARMQSDPREVATELIKSGDQVRKHTRSIARALYQEALKYNPGSDVARSRLGQLLYSDGDYEGAVERLERVREDDPLAKLFYGWATLELSADDPKDVARARDEIVVALRRLSLGKPSSEDREKWLEQVAKLNGRGSEFEQAVQELLTYANNNAMWPPIAESEVTPRKRTSSTPSR